MNITEYFVDKDGFRGQLFEPENRTNKVIIIFMGGEGKIISAGLLADKLAHNGFSALALYYCKGKGLSKQLSEISLEMVEKSISYLKTRKGYEKIGVYGISLGSILAFMSGVFFNDISCVIGVSPTHIIPEGFINKRKCSGKSFLSYKGKPLPYIPLENDLSNYDRFQNAYENSLGEGYIPIEKIEAKILLIAGSKDESWNAVYSVEQLKNQLYENKFPYQYKTCIYDGSHYIGIIPNMKKHKSLHLIKLISKTERENKRLCEEARQLSEQEIVKWLCEW